MKKFKLFISFIIFFFIAAGILSFFMATSQKVEKSITINAPANTVYEQLVKLENFNKWSVWNQQDSSVKHTMTGVDGTIGAATSWSGSPEISGEGTIAITDLETNKKVVHAIDFIKPRKNKASSVFLLKETEAGTLVTWKFELTTPRPWNIFNLFYSMEKEKGKDFEAGLAALKKIVEKK